jgi:uncharacterized membrane protein YbhN (UPF0104 family)
MPTQHQGRLLHLPGCVQGFLTLLLLLLLLLLLQEVTAAQLLLLQLPLPVLAALVLC